MENFKVILNQTVRSFTIRYNGIKWRSATTKEDVQGILDNFDEPTEENPITLNDEVILKGGRKTLLSVIKSLFGTGIPNGGTTGQVLLKQSEENGDAGWSDVSTILDEFEESTPTLEDEVILGGGKKATVEKVLSLFPASNPEIYIGPTQPANTFKIWVQTNPSD